MINELSLKELFERLVVLETKLDIINQNVHSSKKHNNLLAGLIIFSVILDILIHLFLFLAVEKH